jgi:hypothetical protein
VQGESGRAAPRSLAGRCAAGLLTGCARCGASAEVSEPRGGAIPGAPGALGIDEVRWRCCMGCGVAKARRWRRPKAGLGRVPGRGGAARSEEQERARGRMQGVGSTCASPAAGGVVTCRGPAAAKGQVLALAQLGPRQGDGARADGRAWGAGAADASIPLSAVQGRACARAPGGRAAREPYSNAMRGHAWWLGGQDIRMSRREWLGPGTEPPARVGRGRRGTRPCLWLDWERRGGSGRRAACAAAQRPAPACSLGREQRVWVGRALSKKAQEAGKGEGLGWAGRAGAGPRRCLWALPIK